MQLFATRRQGILFAMVNLWLFATYLALELGLKTTWIPGSITLLSTLILIGDKATRFRRQQQ